MATSGVIANFPNGFRGGYQVQGFPVLNTYATSAGPNNPSTAGVWFVDSNTGTDGNKGDSWYQPLKTLARAWVLAKAGDIIQLKPGHAETVSTSTAAAWATKNVQIIGYGLSSQQPTITLDTANTSTITVSADGISVTNVAFVANFLAIAALFTLTTAKSFTVNGCTISDTSASLNFIDYFKLSTTSNANDHLTVVNNNINSLATSGAVKLLDVLGTHDSVVVQNNSYLTLTTNAGAIMPIATTKKLTNFLFLGNIVNVQNAAGTGTGYLITTDTAGTGFIHGNFLSALPTTPLLVTAAKGYVYGINYHTDTADTSGYIIPAQDS